MIDSVRLIDVSKRLIKETFFEAQNAHNFLFENYRDERSELISGILLNNAISTYGSLKAFYYSNLDVLEDSRVETLLYKFEVFRNEFLNNISSGHSHQWTDIEFEAFKTAVIDLLGDI